MKNRDSQSVKKNVIPARVKYIWEGTLIRMGESMPIRQVITKESDKRFAATYFLRNEANNGWETAINEVCDRQESDRANN